MTTEYKTELRVAAQRAADRAVAKFQHYSGNALHEPEKFRPEVREMILEEITVSHEPATIYAGDVVTLASGGTRWTVLEVMVTTKGEHVAYLAQDAEAGVRTWWTSIDALRKVEPEPPRQDMDEETRRHIYDVVKEWTKAWDEEPRASILQRWLDAGAPLHASDEEMRAALVKCADLFLEWHSERHPPNAYPVLAAKIQRWLDAQGVK